MRSMAWMDGLVGVARWMDGWLVWQADGQMNEWMDGRWAWGRVPGVGSESVGISRWPWVRRVPALWLRQ